MITLNRELRTPSKQIIQIGIILALLLLYKSATSIAHTNPQPKPTKDKKYASIHGVIRDAESGETLTGASVVVLGSTLGVNSNTYGAYSLRLRKGKYTVRYSYVGYQPQEFSLALQRDSAIDVELNPSIEIQEVFVLGKSSHEGSRTVRTGTHAITKKMINDIPTLLGERDALKIVQLMPGVQKGREGSSGLYVRGGSADQNLIILDEAPVYNAQHLMGMFSLFNGTALKDMEVIKGGFPARYGGRLASVLDISMDEGNLHSYHGEASLGFISAQAMFQGPIVKEKVSFVLTGRRTYADLLLGLFQKEEEEKTLYFYDATMKLRWLVNRKHTLYLSTYIGKDKFALSMRGENENDYNSSGMSWGNATTTLRWNWFTASALFSNMSLYYSTYLLNTGFDMKSRGAKYSTHYVSGVKNIGWKWDWTWTPHPQHRVLFGIQSLGFRFKPSSVDVKLPNQNSSEGKKIYSLENALYLEDEINLWGWGKLSAGLRATHYLCHDFSRIAIEPRFSSVFYLSDALSLKSSFSLSKQNIHLLSNAGLGLPTDIWVPGSKTLTPSYGWIVSAGAVYDLNAIGSTLTLEGYYKQMHGIIHYKEGASFGSSSRLGAQREDMYWEKDMTQGQGWSSGLEILLQRKIGRLSGWLGYTLSWSRMQYDALNRGRWFWSSFDRRHDFSAVLMYELSTRWRLSGSWVYGSGCPFTLPTERYQSFEGPRPLGASPIEVAEYNEYNNTRMHAYHRLDLGVQYKLNWKRVDAHLSLDIYNVYCQKNPFFYFLDSEQRQNPETGEWEIRNKLQQVSLFPIIPSLSFHLKF